MSWLQLILESDPESAEQLSELLEQFGAVSISMSAMMSKGVDGIITDKPQLATNIKLERAELSVHQRIMIQLASFIGKQPHRPKQ